MLRFAELKLNRDCRLLREVIWKEIEDLSKMRAVPDMLSTINSIIKVYTSLLNNGYDYESTIEEFDYALTVSISSLKERPSVTDIDWAQVEPEILEQCLDDNMQLIVSDALLESMGLNPGEYLQPGEKRIKSRIESDKYISNSRDVKARYQRERFYNSKGKYIRTRYVKWDEEKQTHKRVVVNTLGGTKMTKNELTYAISTLWPPPREHTRNRLGLWIDLYISVVKSFQRLWREFDKRFLEEGFIQLVMEVGIDEATKRRREAIKKHLTTKGGKYNESTDVFWRNGLILD